MKIVRIITQILAIAGALTFVVLTILDNNDTPKGESDIEGTILLLGIALYYVGIFILTFQTKYPRMSSWFALAMALIPPIGITLLIVILEKYS